VGILTPLVLDNPDRLLAQEERSSDVEFVGPLSEAERDILIVTRGPIYFRNEPVECGSLCLRLLYNRRFDSVTVARAAISDPAVAASYGSTFRLEKRDRCPEPSRPDTLIGWQTAAQNGSDKVLAGVLGRLSVGECFIRDDLRESLAALTLTWSERTRISPRSSASVESTLERGRVRLSLRSAGQEQVLFQRTSTIQKALGPFLFFNPATGLISSLEPGWQRWDVNQGSFYVADIEKQLFGAAAEPPEGAPHAILRDRLTSVLNNPTATNLVAVANAYLGSVMSQGEVTSADIAVQRALIADDRYTFRFEFHPAFKRNQAQIDLLADVALQRALRFSTLPLSGNDSSTVYVPANFVAQASPEAFKALSEPIFALMSHNSIQAFRSGLVARLGELGPLGDQRLVALLSDWKPETIYFAYNVVSGICRAGRTSAGQVEALENVVVLEARRHRDSAIWDTSEVGSPASFTLARLGHTLPLNRIETSARFLARLKDGAARATDRANPCP
jgi:hypothetical protein